MKTIRESVLNFNHVIGMNILDLFAQKLLSNQTSNLTHNLKWSYIFIIYNSGTQRDKQSIRIFFNFVYYKTSFSIELSLSTRKKEKWRWQERFCFWFWPKFVMVQDHTLLHIMTWIIMTYRLKNRVIYQRVLKTVQVPLQ